MLAELLSVRITVCCICETYLLWD